MKNLVLRISDIINEKKESLKIREIILFESEIEDEMLIDYIFFDFGKEFSFGVQVDSNGESIEFVSYDSILKNAEFTGLKYNKRNIIEKDSSLIGFEYKMSEIDELNFLSFSFDNLILNIGLKLDSFKVNLLN